MKFDNKRITFSKKDLYRRIALPKELNEDLAYLLGFHLGDGHMRQCRRRSGAIESAIFYDGHSINEYPHYREFICPLIRRLFNYEWRIDIRKNSNNLRIMIGSRAIVDFLHLLCGLPIGPKTDASIPEVVLNANKEIKCAFLRGLVDTDGSLVFKNKKGDKVQYPTIDFQMSNRRLIEDIAKMLKELGFSFHSGSRMKNRYERLHESHYIQINGKKSLEKWMSCIGFSSSNHLTKLQVWEKFKYLQPRTSILDRMKMLEENPLK